MQGIPIPKCDGVLQMFRFNHMSDRCRKPPICLKCGLRTHKNQNREEEKLCPNCEELNTKFGMKLDIRHSEFDRICTVLNRKIDNAKNSYNI